MLCAVQTVIGNSDHQPILQLTGLVAGHYVFQLEVADEAGHKSHSTASVLIKPGWLTLLISVVLTAMKQLLAVLSVAGGSL